MFHILNKCQTHQLSTKEEDVNNNITDLSHMKEEIRATAERCSSVFIEYSDKRKQVINYLTSHSLNLSRKMFS